LRDGLDDFRQRDRQLRRRDDASGEQLDQQVIVGRVENGNLRAALGRLAQALRDERMILAQETADDQHAVELAELGDRHA